MILKKNRKNHRLLAGKCCSKIDFSVIEESKPGKMPTQPNIAWWILTFISIVVLFRDKRARLDPKDYTIGDLTDELVAKMPGEINGQQFIIQNNKVSLCTWHVRNFSM